MKILLILATLTFCLPFTIQAQIDTTPACHAGAQASSASGTATTSNVDCSSASSAGRFCLVAVATYQHDATGAIAGDSLNGTYTNHINNSPTTPGNPSDGMNTTVFYKTGVSVSSSMNFTGTLASGYASVVGGCWGGVNTSPLDKQGTGNTLSGNNVAAGTITPTINVSNVLVLTALASLPAGGSALPNVPSGFTALDHSLQTGSNGGQLIAAYKIYSVAPGSITPNWDVSPMTGFAFFAADVASFLDGTSSSPQMPPVVY